MGNYWKIWIISSQNTNQNVAPQMENLNRPVDYWGASVQENLE